MTIRAKVIVNATGPCSDRLRQMDDPSVPRRLVGSSGTHIILDKSFTPEGVGLLLPKTADGRVLFLLPWHGKTLVGTTDIPVARCRDPKPTEEEISYLLAHLQRYLGLEIDRSEISAAWAGIRPLLRPDPGRTTAEASRDFLIEPSSSGLYSVMGGKWSSYRKMAEAALDRIAKNGEIRFAYPCSTKETALVGSRHFHSAEIYRQLVVERSLQEDVAQHLVDSYGDMALQVAELATRLQLTKRIVEGYSYIEGEVVHAVKEEMAQTSLDVLRRRLPLAAIDQKAAMKALPRIMDLMAKELGWNEERLTSERENTLIN